MGWNAIKLIQPPNQRPSQQAKKIKGIVSAFSAGGDDFVSISSACPEVTLNQFAESNKKNKKIKIKKGGFVSLSPFIVINKQTFSV